MSWFSSSPRDPWQICRTCPNRTQSGNLFAADNCIKRAERAYDTVASGYLAQHKNVEFEYKRIQFFTLLNVERVVCCGQAAARGTVVAELTLNRSQKVEVDHYVLVVSVEVRSWWWSSDWEHTIYDGDDVVTVYRWSEVDDWLLDKYRPAAIGKIEVSTQEFYHGAETWQLLKKIWE